MSVKVTGVVPSVTLVMLGVVLMAGLAAPTSTCSLASLMSEAPPLFASPLYVASHWYVPATAPAVGSV